MPAAFAVTDTIAPKFCPTGRTVPFTEAAALVRPVTEEKPFTVAPELTNNVAAFPTVWLLLAEVEEKLPPWNEKTF